MYAPWTAGARGTNLPGICQGSSGISARPFPEGALCSLGNWTLAWWFRDLYLIRLLKGHFLHSVQNSRPRVVVGTSMSNSRHSQLRSISMTFDLQAQVAGGWRAPWSSSSD